jgi:hypothetical protein
VIIGLSGYKGSGKDTVADYLVERHGFIKISFAKKLKQSASALFGIEEDNWEVWKNDPNIKISIKTENSSEPSLEHAKLTAREFLQRYGTEAHREIFGDDFWVENAFSDVNNFSDYVVPDCRFENEINEIHKRGGLVVRIDRQLVSPDSLLHISEAPPNPDLIDWHLDNNSSIDVLYNNIDILLSEAKMVDYAV